MRVLSPSDHQQTDGHNIRRLSVYTALNNPRSELLSCDIMERVNKIPSITIFNKFSNSEEHKGTQCWVVSAFDIDCLFVSLVGFTLTKTARSDVVLLCLYFPAKTLQFPFVCLEKPFNRHFTETILYDACALNWFGVWTEDRTSHFRLILQSTTL